MAEGALAASGADLSLAITGIAGPGGGSEGKPVGLVWFAYRRGSEGFEESELFAGGRDEVRAAAAERAMRRAAELAERHSGGLIAG
jgi:nicotinamide-nucleotide amidase